MKNKHVLIAIHLCKMIAVAYLSMSQTFDKVAQMLQEYLNKPSDAPADRCPYIQVDKLQEIGVYTFEQFNNLMSKEAEKPAPKFAKFLHLHMKSGYLNFGDDNKRHVFNTLRIYYPNMKGYTYGNFALYF